MARWLGESPKTERWKDGSLCYTISTSALSYRTHCCQGTNLRRVDVSFISNAKDKICLWERVYIQFNKYNLYTLGGGSARKYGSAIWCGSGRWHSKFSIALINEFLCFLLLCLSVFTSAVDEFNYKLCSLFKFYQQPVLDIKPYLPYCDSIQGAAVPEWVMV